MTVTARSATADAMTPATYRVADLYRELADTFTVDLVPDAEPLLRFRPGQFVMLYVPGVGEAPISISSDAAATDHLSLTIRRVRAVTTAASHLTIGDPVGVRGPFGTGWPLPTLDGGDLVVVAGGIGLAPLRSVLYWAAAHRDRMNRLVLLYGTRNPDAILFRQQLAEWPSRTDIEVEITVDAADLAWPGDVGLVTTLIPRARIDPATDTLALVCGPEVMMRYVARELAASGIPADHIFVSMERNMHCGIGLCGHCQLRSAFVCTDGPVLPWPIARPLMAIREL